MTAEGAIVMEGTDSQKHTSLRYLRLRNDFRNMIKSGMDAYDEQTFMNTFQEEAERRHLKHIYQLIRKQMEAVVEVAAVEMEAACDEVGLQQQLEELEALILQRGLLSTETGLPESSNLPLAAETAARLAAKQAENKQLQETLQELLKQQAAVQADLEQKQQQANDLLRDFRDVEDQVDKVYKAGKKWMQRVDGQQEAAMER